MGCPVAVLEQQSVGNNNLVYANNFEHGALAPWIFNVCNSGLQ